MLYLYLDEIFYKWSNFLSINPVKCSFPSSKKTLFIKEFAFRKKKFNRYYCKLTFSDVWYPRTWDLKKCMFVCAAHKENSLSEFFKNATLFFGSQWWQMTFWDQYEFYCGWFELNMKNIVSESTFREKIWIDCNYGNRVLAAKIKDMLKKSFFKTGYSRNLNNEFCEESIYG